MMMVPGAPSLLASLRVWILAARPKTLPAAIAPVIIGAALAAADRAFHAFAVIAALLGAILIQIGTNFANDLMDFKKSVDTHQRLGPLRVTQAGLVTPAQMRNATILVFVLAFVAGIYLVNRGGWPIVVIGLLSIAFGILYTAGPFPLGYNGLGEMFVLIFFGPIAVGGTYYVSARSIGAEAILAGLSPGMLSTAILVVNNTRDMETDKAAGKRTLAVRFGRAFSANEYSALVLGAIAYPAAYYIFAQKHAYSLVALLALIPAMPLIRDIHRRSGTSLNKTLASTGRLLALYGLLFSVGWLLKA